MITNSNIVNNSRYIGDQLRLTEDDIICCPPPLFHCFGLVLGLCGCITHGATFVLPSPTFDPTAVVEAVVAEKCTGLHGVPTMFIAVLEQLRIRQLGGIRLRTGVVAGSLIPPALMEELRQVFGLEDLIIAYGITTHDFAWLLANVF
jgi:acyl-CoA synthetase (AMP-forming)/AMP-acid ligase II